jgi:ribose transport system ATP-binding protein
MISDRQEPQVMHKALAISGLTKGFNGNLALRGVSLDVGQGEIVGLLGHNGSGKSTLVKCLAGYYLPDKVDRLELFGRSVSTADLAELAARGRIGFVHQDLGLIPDLSVLENFQLTALRGQTRPYIDWRSFRIAVQQAMAGYGLDIDVDAPLSTLSQADRCLIAVVRALRDLDSTGNAAAGNERLLILDEPTPFLPAAGVARLFALMRQFTASGGSVIFIAHDIDEVMSVTDRIIVLRDGENVASFLTAEVSRDEVVTAIVGKTLEFHHVEHRDQKSGSDMFVVKDLSGGDLRDVSFTVSAGEIIGVTGLIGSGAALVPELLTGARSARRGTLEAFGQTIALARVTVGEQMQRGICLLPDDRLRKSGVGELSLAENLALPALDRFVTAGWLNVQKLTTHAETVARQSGAVPYRPAMALGSFSGGNQQKALIAKWLALEPKLFAMSEPTQGVDVGARQSIYAAIEDAARKGAAIVCYSSDSGELAQLCDRVIIISKGAIVAELGGTNLTKDNITTASLGTTGELHA